MVSRCVGVPLSIFPFWAQSIIRKHRPIFINEVRNSEIQFISLD